MSPRLRTAFTSLLSVRVPICSAPMAGAAGGALAAAVHKAGGFGFIAAAASPEATQKEIDIARKALDLSPQDKLPLGIGLLLHRFEPERTSNAPSHEPMFKVVLDAQPRAIWLSFGADLRKWVRTWREMERSQQREPAKVFISVGSVREAKEVFSWDEAVDVIVAQGTEAGGHGPTYDVGLPTISIIPQLARIWPSPSAGSAHGTSNAPLLLAAGGISSPEQLVAALALGASGAVVGTHLLLTPESLYSDAQKNLLRRSSGEDTVRSMRFDEARGTLGWGDGVDGRGIASETSRSRASSDELRKVYDEAAKTGDVNTIITWSGTSIGLVNDIKPAEDIIKGMESGAIERLQRLRGFLEDETEGTVQV